MNNKHDDRVSALDDANQSGQSGTQPDATNSAIKKDIERRERNVAEGESTILAREKLVDAREDVTTLRENAAGSREACSDLRDTTSSLREKAADLREGTASLREGAADLREEKVASREQKTRMAEAGQAAWDDQASMLREANENLVNATLDAYKLAEEIGATKERLDHLAYHDVLTDLPNRLLLQDRLKQAIELALRQGKQLAVMFLDLDGFKHINDSLGHAVGDQLLQAVAQRLLTCVRHSDTVSRQGGDEFLVLLPTLEDTEAALLAAQKMLAALARPYLVDHHDLHISVSMGVSMYPQDGRDAETLIKNADTAMYHAKESGRNNYKLFEKNMNIRAVQRQSTEASLRRALERSEFVLYYQPKINLRSGKIVGVEALIRWNHPERGLLLPAQFVAIAEDCGLILPIGRWVLREACRQARVWREANLQPITMAVNASALEFSAKDFIANVRSTLDAASLEACHLELELTESVLMRDVESTNTLLHALADMGVKLAVDDFGTGYSSLSYLRQFPVDTLKIDQSFVKRMNSNADDATIVTAVINLGRNLQKRVIAEGIETPEQHEFLLAQNCDEGQGYHFGRPMIAAALAALLQQDAAPAIR